MVKYEDIRELCDRVIDSKYDSQLEKLDTVEKIQDSLNNMINMNLELMRNCDVIKKLEAEMEHKGFEDGLSAKLDEQYTIVDEKVAQVTQDFEAMNYLFEQHGMKARFEIADVEDFDKVIAQTTSITDEMRFQGISEYKRYQIDLKQSFKNYSNQEERDANSAIYKTDKFIQSKTREIINAIDPERNNLNNPEVRTAIGEAMIKAGIYKKDFEEGQPETEAEKAVEPISLDF